MKLVLELTRIAPHILVALGNLRGKTSSELIDSPKCTDSDAHHFAHHRHRRQLVIVGFRVYV